MALVAVACVVSMLAGCGGGEGNDAASAVTTTSVVAAAGSGSGVADAPPPVPFISESELRRRVDGALATSAIGDPCPLYGIVATVVPDVSDPAAARRAYRIIASGLARVEARAELAEPWSVLIEATGREADDGGGGAAFAGAEVHRALDLLDAACGGT